MIQEFRHAFRVLFRQPSITLLAILAIAIGIAANAAIFSVVEGVLLRPLPYKDADRLIFIRSDFQGEVGLPGIATAEIEDIRTQSKLIEQIGWMIMPSASLTGDNQMERVPAATTSDEFLSILGVRPALGRSLSSKEDRDGYRIRNLMISDELWQRRYHGDPNIIGRSIELNNYNVSIVGVLPKGFRMYLGGDTNVNPQIDLWFAADPGSTINRSLHRNIAIARLRPNVTVEQAQTEIDAIAARMVEQNPKAYPEQRFRLHVAGLRDDVVKPVRTSILVLMGAVGFILLIACANVANLLLARASGRRAEIAIRAALGAGQLRVIRQMLTESVVLALAGGVAGLLLAQQGIDLLLYLKPENLPRQDNISLNATVTIVTLGLSVLSGIFFGLAPAWQAGRMNIQSILKESGRSKASGASGSRIRTALVTVQVAASLILLIGAILMIRTFENMRRLDLGFNPTSVLTLRVDYDSKIIQGVETWRFYKRAIDAVRNQPGVESASAANFLPFGMTWTDDFATEEKPERTWTALYNPILPEYFHTMRIPLTAGRDFTEKDNDDAAAVVIVNQSFAERTWPGENPIGKRLTLHPASKDYKKALEVVGVAGDTRLSIRPDERPQIYVPFGSDYGFFLMVAVRTKTDPVNLAPLLRRALEGAGGNRPVWDIRPMDDYLSIATAETRFALLLLSVLAAVAVVLCLIGVYGVVSYSISERMQEFAIRIAIGAQSGAIIRLVLIRGLTPAFAGVGIGVVSAYALTRFLRAMLFNVSPTDTLTYVLASAALLAAALLACYVPIRSLALRTNPRKFLL